MSDAWSLGNAMQHLINLFRQIPTCQSIHSVDANIFMIAFIIMCAVSWGKVFRKPAILGRRNNNGNGSPPPPPPQPQPPAMN